MITVIPAMVQRLFFDIIKQCDHKYATPPPWKQFYVFLVLTTAPTGVLTAGTAGLLWKANLCVFGNRSHRCFNRSHRWTLHKSRKGFAHLWKQRRCTIAGITVQEIIRAALLSMHNGTNLWNHLFPQLLSGSVFLQNLIFQLKSLCWPKGPQTSLREIWTKPIHPLIVQQCSLHLWCLYILHHRCSRLSLGPKIRLTFLSLRGYIHLRNSFLQLCHCWAKKRATQECTPIDKPQLQI